MRIIAGAAVAHCVRNEFAIFGATETYGRIIGAWSVAVIRNENRCFRLHDARRNGRIVLD